MNANPDLAAANKRYVMRITGDNEKTGNPDGMKWNLGLRISRIPLRDCESIPCTDERIEAQITEWFEAMDQADRSDCDVLLSDAELASKLWPEDLI